MSRIYTKAQSIGISIAGVLAALFILNFFIWLGATVIQKSDPTKRRACRAACLSKGHETGYPTYQFLPPWDWNGCSCITYGENIGVPEGD